ncbi:hypothetical protein B8W66_12905 [Mycobacterium decipiens]|uniref:Membrane transport protein MMPL domain-containing protein n=1 Tax=Mycobacterium decipiens TaxID=1430326 RepID=A0A1X2LU43_9MYCO|nr:hypothetical protein B8W66_12905 [Mycobacterium decipiens]
MKTSSADDGVATIADVSADGPSRLAKLLVVAVWAAVAVTANVILALAHAKASEPSSASALLPRHATTTAANGRIAQAFPDTGTNAIAYLVVEGSDTLEPADEQYFDAAVSALRADSDHVGSVLDWSSDPLTAALATSADGRSGSAMVWLRGEAGSARAQESLDAARSVVGKLPPSSGLRIRIIAPATTTGMPLHMSAWQGAAIVIAAALIAVALLLRAGHSAISVGIALLTAGLSRAVAWPVVALVGGHDAGKASAFAVFSGTLAAVLTIGTITASTMLVARVRPEGTDSAPDRHAYRDMLPALALPGACVALLTGPLLLAQTPALHSVGTAALGVVVALIASLTLLPALTGLAGPWVRSSPRTGGAAWARRLPIPSFLSPVVVTAVVLAICALPVIGMRSGVAENLARVSSARFLPGDQLPDVVVVKSTRDLLDPAGLIAIDQISHRLMEIPGVRKVESAAWPAGIPWTDASLTSAAGRLADQLNQQAGSFFPVVNAIKSMKSIVDQMGGAVDQLESTVNVSVAGAHQAQRYLDPMLAAAQNLKNKTAEVSGYLDTIRNWIVGFTNCPNNELCAAMRKVMEPYDVVVAGMNELSNGASRISAISAQTMNALNSAPRLVAQMRSALEQVRSFVPQMETTIQDVMPQVAQASAMLKNLSADFADTGEGGFHLSRKDLADPSYRHVRESMFSSDGTATRLFVYSHGDNQDLDAAARTQQLEIAAGKAMKYGSLVDAQITVNGAAQVATAVRAALTHDVVLLAVTMLAAVTLVGVWRRALIGVTVGLGVLASYLAALGVSVMLWQHLLDSELQAAVPLVSFALLAAFGVPYLIATVLATDATDGTRSAGTVSVRGAVAPIAALGAVFGGGLLLVSGGSFSALSQLGTVLVIGLGALTATARVCIPALTARDRTGQPAVAESPATKD